jgi:hypothetical protein
MTKTKLVPLNCPFCGTEMRQHEHCFSHPRLPKGDCVLRYYSFDNDKVDEWNTRTGA